MSLTKTKRVPASSDLMSAEELSVFKKSWNASKCVDRHPPCCSLTNFTVDLVGLPKNPWNESASRVFSAYFVQKYPQHKGSLLLVQKAFFARIKTLKRLYNGDLQGPAAKERAMQAARRYARKKQVCDFVFHLSSFIKTVYQLFARRVELTNQHPLLQCHIPMLERLGIPGMSSDESETEYAQAADSYDSVFYVHKPSWRSQTLTEWLKALDSIHMRMRGKRGPGSLPRLRIRSNDYDEAAAETGMSSGKFVDGLPMCAYSSKWLADHIGLGFGLGVHPTNEEYSFTIDNRLFS